MPIEERVLIAGAGPVGLVAAANLVRGGVPVTVFEAGPDLSEESRASTFHPPTLDMLDRLGAARPLIAQGLTAPAFQYRSRRHGVLAQFDFGAIADVTAHPYRVQCEQSKLTRILYRQLREKPDFELQFDAQVKDVTQHRSGVEIAIERNGRTETRTGRWLIGADGARSEVRRALGIEFPGFTWPERFLVVSTPFNFRTVIPDLVAVSYVSDPERWHFLLQIPGLCRVMFPIAPHESDELAVSADFAQSLMATVVPGVSNYEVAHVTLYKVHQRVAKTFQRGRAFLVGDAAHINNPLGEGPFCARRAHRNPHEMDISLIWPTLSFVALSRILLHYFASLFNAPKMVRISGRNSGATKAVLLWLGSRPRRRVCRLCRPNRRSPPMIGTATSRGAPTGCRSSSFWRRTCSGTSTRSWRGAS